MKDGKSAENKAKEVKKPEVFVVEASPLSKSPRAQSLSYFTKEKIIPGELIWAPVRNSFQLAVVTRVLDAVDTKTDLKKASFALRKIGKSDLTGTALSKPILLAAERASLFYASSIGNILDSIIPNIFQENLEFISEENSFMEKGLPLEPLVIQVETEERRSRYKSIIRESFAKKSSILFISPTEEEAENAFKEISQGISEFAFLFTPSKKPALQKKILKAAQELEHPILLVTTPAGLAFQRKDMSIIIIDRENSRVYRQMTRPFLHIRTFLEFYAKEAHKQLILGDSVLSLESMWHEKRGDYRELSAVKWRLALPGSTTLVDMKAGAPGEFVVISPELAAVINTALAEKNKIFLFAARKGLSPITICGDCSHIMACKNCRAPLVLYGKPATLPGQDDEKRLYLCHSCGAKRSAATLCDKCKSWKLVPLGIGTELVKKVAHEMFPRADISILDKEHAPTKPKAKKIIKHFIEHGDILVGTELAFMHLEKVPITAIVSADALFSIPDFGIHERIFYLVSHLREMSIKACIIQTRNIGKQILGWAAQGNILDFYRSEIEERKMLLYPPYSIFIKLSSERKNLNDLLALKERLSKWNPDIVRDSLILRLPSERWPDKDLSAELSLLGPEFLIKVDPESIL